MISRFTNGAYGGVVLFRSLTGSRHWLSPTVRAFHRRSCNSRVAAFSTYRSTTLDDFPTPRLHDGECIESGDHHILSRADAHGVARELGGKTRV